jgi:hypothetical protein
VLGENEEAAVRKEERGLMDLLEERLEMGRSGRPTAA